MLKLPFLSKAFASSQTLKQAAGILFVTVLISNVLGLIRNVVIANRVGLTYGTIGPLDNYYAAFVLPDLLYNFIIVGALSAAVLPMLVELDTKKGSEVFWRSFNSLLSTGFTAILIAMVLLFATMGFLIQQLLPGFSAADIDLATTLGKVLLLSPLFFTISQLSSSALQAKRHFFAPAIAPIVYNLAIISGALLIPRFGLPVLVFGVIIGAAAHFLVQLPTLIRLGWRFSFLLELRGPVKEVVKLMIPRAIALTGNQLLLIAFYRIASNFEQGSIAIYRLTDDLQTAPVLLLANTIAMAALPNFARRLASDQHEDYRLLIGKALRFIFYCLLPMTIFLLVLSREIIGLYISIGHAISQAELSRAVMTFQYFVLSLFFQGVVLILARAYFAKGDTARPMLFSLGSVAIALTAALWISRVTDAGVAGLSAAFSLGALTNAVLLWAGLRLPVSTIIRDESSRNNFAGVVSGSLVFALVLILLNRLSPEAVAPLNESPSVGYLIKILFVGVPGWLFYLAWSRAFDLEQWRLIKGKRASTTS